MKRYTLLLRAQRASITALAAWAVLAVWLGWDALPTRLASHFDSAGRPNGYMSRDAFFVTLAAISCAVVLPLAFVPTLLRRFPNAAINLPHRDYWLAAERRVQSLERIGVFCGWFAVANSAMFVMVVELTMKANAASDELDMTLFHIGFGLYLVSVAVLLIGTFRRFFRPPAWPTTGQSPPSAAR